MKRFEFDNRKVANRANGNRREEITVHGAVEIYHDNFREGLLSLDIRGPVKAYRGCALIDKATAGKLGAALMQWAGLLTYELTPESDTEGRAFAVTKGMEP